MLVRWDTVLAWAADDAMLAPLGFQRGFFRTEFSTEKGASDRYRGRCHDVETVPVHNDQYIAYVAYPLILYGIL